MKKLLLVPLLLLLALPALLGISPTKTAALTTFGADNTGTNDTSSAWIAAAAAGVSHLDLPPGQYLLNGTATVNLSNIEVECHGAAAQYNTPPSYGTSGATILLTSTSVQPFALAGGVRFKGCNFFWPNQLGTSSTPTAYPPLFTEQSGKQINSFACNDCTVVDAYDFLDQTSTANTDAFGAMGFTNLRGYAIRYWFQLANVPEWVKVNGFYSDYGIYQTVSNASPNYYLANWTAANGAFLHVFGNGNGSTVGSTVYVAGFHCTDCEAFAYNKFAWVDSTGALAESIFDAIYDSIPHVLEVDTGGCAADVEMRGAVYSYQWVSPSGGPGGTDNAAPFSFGTPPTSANCITTNIRISGHLFASNGDVIDITGTNNKYFYVSLSGAGQYGQSSTAGTYYFSQVNSSTAIVDFQGNHVEPKTAGATRLGFNLVNCFSCTLNGNSFNGVYNPIIIGSSSVPVAGTGNISANSPTGGTPVVGTGNYAHQLLTGNVWDKYANPGISACGTGGAISNGQSNDISGVITVGTGATSSCTATFANQWSATGVRCYINGPIASAPYASSTNATTLTITSNASMASATISYKCDGGW